MTGEELHNFCKFLYSQIQSKDEEISRLTANIKELTDEVRLSRLQQQTYNDENKAVSATHSQKLDVVLQQLQETRQDLLIQRESWKQLRPCWQMPMRKTVSWKLNERRMPRSVKTWRMISLCCVLIFTVEQRVSSNYLHKFWKQVFAYRNDGEYTIDNLAAERAIRPQTIQRKGSLF